MQRKTDRDPSHPGNLRQPKTPALPSRWNTAGAWCPSRVSRGLEFHRAETQPRGKLLQFGVHGLGHRMGEPDVLVDRVHQQPRDLPVCDCVHLADKSVVVEDRQREVAPPSLVSRLVHLQGVLEVEQIPRADAIMDQPVEWRQQRRTTLELSSDGRRVHYPATRSSLDLSRLTLD